jgi:hypothetical protein
MIWDEVVLLLWTRGRRPVAALLVALVLAGGICPALYLGQIPHTHLFVGGPPPLDWEDHQHDNPLLELLGSPARALAADSGDLIGSSAKPDGLDVGRVVSVYAGAPWAVMALIAVSLLGPTVNRLLYSSTGVRFFLPEWRLVALLAEAPSAPPPRSL